MKESPVVEERERKENVGRTEGYDIADRKVDQQEPSPAVQPISRQLNPRRVCLSPFLGTLHP